ncbi:hypothetical protein D9M71_332550 [compost metagenome]
MLKLPIRLMPTMRLKLSRPCGPLRPSTFSPPTTPAQLTSPCSAPKVSRAAATALRAASSLVMSATRPRALAPSSAARASTAAARSTSSTLAPASISPLAVAAPSPEAAPVTRKTLLWICMANLSRTAAKRPCCVQPGTRARTAQRLDVDFLGGGERLVGQARGGMHDREAGRHGGFLSCYGPRRTLSNRWQLSSRALEARQAC